MWNISCLKLFGLQIINSYNHSTTMLCWMVQGLQSWVAPKGSPTSWELGAITVHSFSRVTVLEELRIVFLRPIISMYPIQAFLNWLQDKPELLPWIIPTQGARNQSERVQMCEIWWVLGGDSCSSQLTYLLCKCPKLPLDHREIL